MKTGTLSRCLIAALLAGFTLATFAEIKDSPYQIIVDRNPFALKPIPPPPPPPSNEPTNTVAPPSDVKLTGITTLLGPPKVFLEIIDPQTKKTSRPPGLLVGEKEGNVEILAIDPTEGTVHIRQGDTETTLDFDKNGLKPSGVATAAPAHGIPGLVPLNTGLVPQGTVPGAPNPNQNSRAVVVGGSPSVSTAPGFNPSGMANPSMNPSYGVGGMPARPLRADAGNVIVTGQGQSIQPPGATATATAAPIMSREEAELAIEARKRALEAQGDTRARILPPTRFSAPPAPGGAPRPPGQ